MSDFVLVVNSGSSSVKFAVIDAHSSSEILTGLAECLGSDEPRMVWQHNDADDQESEQVLAAGSQHKVAIEQLVKIINENNLTSDLRVIGHRVVHGGEHFTSSVVINDEVKQAIKFNNKLAPLHNPANLEGIEAAQHYFPNLMQVAVFDTAFHQTLPETSYLYALPYSLYELEGIRRYGFHGTSHRYVSEQAAVFLEKPQSEINIITAHLGNGCSICAIKQGESVDTSMGFTPLAGICMGTRSGDVDPGLFSFLIKELAYDVDEIDMLLNKKSGLLGISQFSNDCRALEKAKQAGNIKAALALDIFCYQIAKTIASYTVPLGTIDAIVFTGGIGENSAFIRAHIIDQLKFFSLELSEQENMNKRFGTSGCITTNKGIKVLVIPTNEELVIAKDALVLLNQYSSEQGVS